ncbi:hypothetical protein HDU98_003665 [Podochytrium sp. JEL0797]|nr:hypothetical protein HDU98_003665 [Podochytrium sp. JEL0797]
MSSSTTTTQASESISSLSLNLDPADILCDRAKGWQEFVSALQSNYQRKADFEKAELQVLIADQKQWTSPFPLRDISFAEDSAVVKISSVFQADATKKVSQFTAMQESLQKQTVPALDGIVSSLSQKLSALEKNQKESRTERRHDQDLVTKAKESLAQSLVLARSQTPGKDPWLLKREVEEKLSLATAQHNARNQSLDATKADFKLFEANLIRQLKVALIGVSSISEIIPNRANLSADDEPMLTHFNADAEWDAFCIAKLNRSSSPEMFETEQYEGSDDPLVRVVHEGFLDRKGKGIIQTFKEYFYVITASGYLHEFKSRPSLEYGIKVEPDETVCLNECTVEPFGGGRHPERLTVIEKKGTMLQKSYHFVGTSLSVSQQFHTAIASVAKVALAVIPKADADQAQVTVKSASPIPAVEKAANPTGENAVAETPLPASVPTSSATAYESAADLAGRNAEAEAPLPESLPASSTAA